MGIFSAMVKSDDYAIYDDRTKKKAEEFYGKLHDVMIENNLPFMIGGTYAFTAYTGIVRPTKDIDIRCTFEDYPTLLKTFTDEGYRTEISEEQWIAKVYSEDKKFFTDVIFAEKNGLHKIDQTWLRHARGGEILGRKVKLEPIEEMMRSKMYVQHKERFDGADVVNFILKYGPTIDWQLLLDKMEPHWELVLQHVVLFNFVYPSERNQIPEWVMIELLQKIQEEYTKAPPSDRVTRGLLISSQYEPAVTMWGFNPIHELR